MIAGIGTDIVEIPRIRKMLGESGGAFLSRVFTEAEISEAREKHGRAEYYAGRWAVKEALSKALGCGIGELCSWKDVSTANTRNGAPRVSLSGNAEKHAKRLQISRIHATISHEKNFACATVVLEKTSRGRRR